MFFFPASHVDSQRAIDPVNPINPCLGGWTSTATSYFEVQGFEHGNFVSCCQNTPSIGDRDSPKHPDMLVPTFSSPTFTASHGTVLFFYVFLRSVSSRPTCSEWSLVDYSLLNFMEILGKSTCFSHFFLGKYVKIIHSWTMKPGRHRPHELIDGPRGASRRGGSSDEGSARADESRWSSSAAVDATAWWI